MQGAYKKNKHTHTHTHPCVRRGSAADITMYTYKFPVHVHARGQCRTLVCKHTRNTRAWRGAAVTTQSFLHSYLPILTRAPPYLYTYTHTCSTSHTHCGTCHTSFPFTHILGSFTYTITANTPTHTSLPLSHTHVRECMH